MGADTEGLDELVADLRQQATKAQHDAKPVVTRHAEETADRMRSTIRRLSGKTADSVTSDPARIQGDHVYAEAGPEHFVGRFLEFGTARQAPIPFMDDAVDEAAFERDLAKSIGLL